MMLKKTRMDRQKQAQTASAHKQAAPASEKKQSKAAKEQQVNLAQNGWYPPASTKNKRQRKESPSAAAKGTGLKGLWEGAAKPADPPAKSMPGGAPAVIQAGAAPVRDMQGYTFAAMQQNMARPGMQLPNGVTGNQLPPPPRQTAVKKTATQPKRKSPSSYAPTGNGKSGGQQPGTHRPERVMLAMVLAIVLLVGGFFGIRSVLTQKQLEAYVIPYNTTFVPGVYVDGISLANMTADQAREAVTQQINSRNNDWKVRLTFQGNEVVSIDASSLGMKVDVESVLAEAWAQGHTGTLEQRRAAMEQLLVTPYQGYTAAPSGDTTVIDRTLKQIQDAVYLQPQDARMVQFDPSSKTPFQFQEEVTGRRLDIAPLKERLYQMVSTMESGDVEIEPETIAPSVTVAQLKTKYTLLSSVYTPISKKSTENRTNNIRRSFEPLNGYILQPTRKMSYNQVVGMRTLENGFYEAPEHVYGQLVEGVGGGTCQASTTLYQAAVTAGMEIVKRKAHSLEVSYSEKGQDATVYWTRDKEIDLVIKNNTHSDLYFVAAVESDPANKSRLVARVTIYGEPLEPGVTYKLESKKLKVITPPEPRYIKDTKAAYVTYTDEQKSVKPAQEGCEVETYRLKYVNGQMVEQKSLGVDIYPARAEEIYVGVTPR